MAEAAVIDRPARSQLRAWAIFGLGALSFGYAFFQRVAPSAMVSDLMRDFGMGAAVLGQLSALYFYPYVALQLPIGILIDRLGVRAMLATAIAFAAAGSLLFGAAGNLDQAYLGRFLIGAGSAVGFVGTLTLAGRWFPPRRFALLTGLVMLFGMGCGVGGQAPLAAAVDRIGWRNAMYAAAAFAAILALAILAVVRDHPTEARAAERPVQGWAALGRGLRRAVTTRETWLLSLVATAMSGPMLAFGGLWGVPYFMTRYGLGKPEAAFWVSLLLLGWALGGPFAGWLSDAVGRRKRPLVAAAGVHLFLIAFLIQGPPLPLGVAAAINFGIGFSAASMVLSFALARETTPAAIHGTVLGIVNCFTVASGAVLQPLIGILLDRGWEGAMAGGARVYGLAAYQGALACLIAWSAIGVLTSLTLPETRCRSRAAAAAAGAPTIG